MSEFTFLRRFSPNQNVSITDSSKRTISGYAAIFNQETNIGGEYFEKIAPGAFTLALQSSDTVCLFNHEPNIILGRRSANTLRVDQDQIGLPFSCDVPDSRTDTWESINRKDVTGCSFAFTVQKDQWEERADGSILRTILEVKKLYDVGPVVYPQYDGTSVMTDSEKKSFAGFKEERSRSKQLPKEKETPLPDPTRPYSQIARLRELNII